MLDKHARYFEREIIAAISKSIHDRGLSFRCLPVVEVLEPGDRPVVRATLTFPGRDIGMDVDFDVYAMLRGHGEGMFVRDCVRAFDRMVGMLDETATD